MTAPKREAPPGLPVTATFSEVTTNFDANNASKRRSINSAALTPAADTRSAWGGNDDARQAVTAVSYRVGNTTPNAVDLRKHDFDGTHIQLDVMQIRSYDDNPALLRKPGVCRHQGWLASERLQRRLCSHPQAICAR